ncbi:MAG TPA: TonB family protein [Dokdonella sp.]
MTDLLLRLSLATLTSSAAMLLVLALRRPIRRVLRAQAAYVLWAVVPLSVAAALLPSRVTTITLQQMQPVAVAHPQISMPAMVPESLPSDQSIDAPAWLGGLWLGGVAAALALFLLQQRRFVRGLGRLSRMTASIRRAETAIGCPPLVGAWSPAIVLPVDFEQRYNTLERALILAHERHHRSHGDAQINALCMLLRSVFWFNPLIHYAASRFRLDQELACDAAVIRQFRGRRRSYASAMLKAQLPAARLPLGCYWPAGDALKERIRLLNTPVAGSLRIGFGAAVAVALVMTGTLAAWAAQPAQTEIRYVDDASSAQTDSASDSAQRPPSEDAGAIDRASRTQATKIGGVAAPAMPAERHATGAGPARAGSAQRRSTLELAGSAGSPARAGSVLASAANPPGAQKTGAARSDDEQHADIGHAVAAVPSEPAATTGAAVTNDRPAEAIPSYRTRIPPLYPAAAVRMPGPRATSTIVLKVDVDEHGNPLGAQVASMDPPTATELATASIAAVVRWQFNPALHDGKPVAGVAWVPFEFVLQGGATSPPLGEITDGRVAPMRRASYRTLTAIDYPRSDALAGVEGVVYVKVRIDADGRVGSVAVDHVEPASARALADAAVAGVNTWTFNPARIAGRDIASSVTVPVVFTRQRAQRLASNGHDYPGTLDAVMAIPKG